MRVYGIGVQILLVSTQQSFRVASLVSSSQRPEGIGCFIGATAGPREKRMAVGPKGSGATCEKRVGMSLAHRILTCQNWASPVRPKTSVSGHRHLTSLGVLGGASCDRLLDRCPQVGKDLSARIKGVDLIMVATGSQLR